MRVEQIAELEDSTALIGDPEALQARWGRDGYLFLRGIIDPVLIAQSRERFREALAAEGLIDPAVEAPVWTGAAPKTRRPCDVIGKTVFDNVIAQPRFRSLLADLLGEAPVWLPIIAHRSALPSGPVSEGQDVVQGRHQDGYFNEGMDIDNCWIPMMDISRANGSLSII